MPYTAADILKFEKADGLGEGVLIHDIKNSAPAVGTLPMIAWEGTEYNWVRQTSNAGAAFRTINDGIVTTGADFTLEDTALHYLDATFDLDYALYTAKPQVYPRFAAAAWQAALFKAEQEVLNGSGTFTNGLGTLVDALTDAMAINAEGATAVKQTTVYLVYANPNDGYSLVAGNGGVISVSEPFKVALEGSTTGTFTAMRTTVAGWLSAQWSTHSVGRIFNVDISNIAATNAFTDDHLAAAISKFPAGRRPSHIIMNAKAQALLRNSRTATNPTGAPAPFPIEAFGAEIVVSDGIPNDLAVVS